MSQKTSDCNAVTKSSAPRDGRASAASSNQDTSQAFIQQLQQMNHDEADAIKRLKQKEQLAAHAFEEHLRKQQRAQAALQSLPYQGRKFAEDFLRVFANAGIK